MHAFLESGIDDLCRRESDAFVDHFHAGIAGAHRDLLGAIGMAVEAGLADKKFDASPELMGNSRDIRAHAFKAAAGL